MGCKGGQHGVRTFPHPPPADALVPVWRASSYQVSLAAAPGHNDTAADPADMLTPFPVGSESFHAAANPSGERKKMCVLILSPSFSHPALGHICPKCENS